mgnify:CR=1 FL=1
MAHPVTQNTTTLEITGISLALMKRIEERAKERGEDSRSFVREWLQESLGVATDSPKQASLEEILSPLREDFENTGMTDDELGEFISHEIKQYRTAHKTKTPVRS